MSDQETTRRDPKIGRLSMRLEGENVCIYYAKTETMNGAILLATCAASFCDMPGVKSAFLDVGRLIVSEVIFRKFGIRPEWGGAEPAPEHERAGRS